MSIKSTKYVSRELAIERILLIYLMAKNGEYKGIEEASFEQNSDIVAFVKTIAPISIGDIVNWTNDMLSDKLDEPFYRWSMFEDYVVTED